MPWPSNPHLIDNPFVGVCRHDYLIPPGIPAIWWFIDFDVVNGITGLGAWPTAKWAFPPARRPDRGEILDVGKPMQGRTTDATIVVPHVPVPLVPSYLLPVIILLGSSKIIMGSDKTRIWCKGLLGLSGEVEQAVGCCLFPYIPVSLNLQCWDFPCKKFGASIGAPVMSDVVFAPNTVQVGISFSDYLTVIIDWAIDILLAVLIAFGTGKATKAWNAHSASKIAAAGDEAAAKALKEAEEKGLSKEAANASAKAAREAAEKEAAKPGTLSKMYHFFADHQAGKEWLLALGLKVPWRLLVRNSEWFRDIKPTEKTI